MKVSCRNHDPIAVPALERALCTLLTLRWLGPRAGLGDVGKRKVFASNGN
jgi:hypothetical protein